VYTIKQAAQRSGVSVPLLRAWERRYGIVEPARTASGYRLYDEAALARLRAMRTLVDDGWAPSTAANRVRELGDDAIADLARSQETGTNGSGERAIQRAGVDNAAPPIVNGREADDLSAADTLTAAFVESVAALDEPAFEAVLDDMFARGSFEHVTTEIVMPSLVAIGERWARGELDVAAEHAAAAAVQRRLGSAFTAAGRPTTETGLVLVGLPPGARHELGALAFATAARRSGVPVSYLGADLPVENWIEAAARTQARAAVVGVVIEDDAEPAERVAESLRATRPDILVCFGGPAAGSVTLDGQRLTLRLPAPLNEAVDALRHALANAG
jgi:DNA-binding transcriptional MerR regulator/methanogenic corrinoid protein MtbC1